jgi:hypothetical protein
MVENFTEHSLELNKYSDFYLAFVLAFMSFLAYKLVEKLSWQFYFKNCKEQGNL